MKKIENTNQQISIYNTKQTQKIIEEEKKIKHEVFIPKGITKPQNAFLLQQMNTNNIACNIISLIEQAYTQFVQTPLKDKEVILVCGDTGSGKSTLINYINNQPLEIKTLKDQRLPVLDCQNQITKIGHGMTSETFIPKRCSFNNMVFWDCPGFEDTNGPDMDITNAYSITKIKNKAENIKVMAVIEESSLYGARRGQAFRDMIIKLDKMFLGNKRLKDSIVICFTKAYNIKDYKSFILNEVVKSKSELNSFQKSFVEEIIKKERFVVFPNPKENSKGLYPISYRNNLLEAINNIKYLADPLMDPVISPKSLHHINELREHVNDEIKKYLENILISVSDNFQKIGLKNSLKVASKLFSVKDQYDNKKYNSDTEMIVTLNSIVENIYDDSKNQYFKKINFLSTEILENIVGKFIPTGDKFEFQTITLPFLELSRKTCHFLISKGYSKEKALFFVKEQYKQDIVLPEQRYGYNQYTRKPYK